jgi:hypothetical protein
MPQTLTCHYLYTLLGTVTFKLIDMKIWIHKGTRRWWTYWKPVWLNRISWKEGDPKIYQWLWWGYCT